MTFRAYRAPLAMLLLCVIASSAGAATQTRLSGIYSDLAYNQEGGDLLGIELLVVPHDSGRGDLEWTAVVQIAEGGAPCVSVGSLQVTGDKIEITLPKEGQCGAHHFLGKLIDKDIQLTEGSLKSTELLKRGKSYWQ